VELSERELEEICIALLRHKDNKGKYMNWYMSERIFNEFQETGRVCLDVVKPE
jgi:hypothetical protein